MGYTGLDGKLIKVDEEQIIVAEIRDMRRGGRSFHKIAADLNGRGIIGKRGGQYYASTIKAICDNAIHA